MHRTTGVESFNEVPRYAFLHPSGQVDPSCFKTHLQCSFPATNVANARSAHVACTHVHTRARTVHACLQTMSLVTQDQQRSISVELCKPLPKLTASEVRPPLVSIIGRGEQEIRFCCCSVTKGLPSGATTNTASAPSAFAACISGNNICFSSSARDTTIFGPGDASMCGPPDLI